MAWGKSVLLTIPLVFSGIFVVASPASAQEFSDTDWQTISAGGSHACGTDNSGYLYCWGNDDSGQLGNSSTLNSKTTPNRVGGSTGWSAVSAGGSHTCAIRSGKLYCWGSDSHGQLGNGAVTGLKPTPVQITTATDWTTVSSGATHTCAIRSIGKLYCWGNDSNGQLGNGAGGPTTVVAQITAATDWKSVTAGMSHTCAIRSIGKLYCWGGNEYGQTVATSDDALFASPQYISSNWPAQDTGQRHTCGIDGGGQMTCWGTPEPPPDCPAPGTNVYAGDPWQELGHWKLTTPVDGTDSGDTADEVKQPALKTLDNKDYFDRLSTPTRIMFRARVDGATTSGSSFPRSELREMTQDGQYNRAAWTSKCGTHRMSITQSITSQPDRSNPEDPVVAGQIHDGGVDGGRGDVAMIRLEGSRLFVEADGNDRGELDANYELGQKFTVAFTVNASKISVQYSNSDNGTSKTITPFTPTVNNEQWYFKAGCYTQANASNGTGYGEVVIYDLAVEHS